jgi:hypothetical protein
MLSRPATSREDNDIFGKNRLLNTEKSYGEKDDLFSRKRFDYEPYEKY